MAEPVTFDLSPLIKVSRQAGGWEQGPNPTYLGMAITGGLSLLGLVGLILKHNDGWTVDTESLLGIVLGMGALTLLIWRSTLRYGSRYLLIDDRGLETQSASGKKRLMKWQDPLFGVGFIDYTPITPNKRPGLGLVENLYLLKCPYLNGTILPPAAYHAIMEASRSRGFTISRREDSSGYVVWTVERP